LDFALASTEIVEPHLMIALMLADEPNASKSQVDMHKLQTRAKDRNDKELPNVTASIVLNFNLAEI
jgi:hypothetical protein